jgi:hypothetical protein
MVKSVSDRQIQLFIRIVFVEGGKKMHKGVKNTLDPPVCGASRSTPATANCSLC